MERGVLGFEMGGLTPNPNPNALRINPLAERGQRTVEDAVVQGQGGRQELRTATEHPWRGAGGLGFKMGGLTPKG